ncbi:putative elongator complex protein 1 [Apostichopus japonicus]|uniref:Elongator complex protein 1 n=1 Tax=Stichopus japonicus TaxID=307972 RepID=A0A2G8JH29_STIJA|nr:putative elongator complex protein 1 [Apostichopus japonicus]
MRNLEVFSAKLTSGFPELRDVHSISVDVDTDRIYATSNSTLFSLNSDKQEIEWRVNLKERGYLEGENDRILALQHLPDIQSVSMATSNGDVILVNTQDKEMECVGTVDSGLTNMCWSPDQELLVLVTGQDTVILMTREFDPDVGEKATQFHGTAGKEAAKEKSEEAGEVLPWDDKLVRISWRGDGEYFVTSAIHPHRGFRQLRIWNRECNLQFTSEEVNGLEQALDWKPSGSLIVSSQRLPNRHDIVFFERNGLRHGEFTLPFDKSEVKVIEVLWNLDSTILAVWMEDLSSGNNSDDIQINTKSYVQLWTVSNYHWYLKQSLTFDTSERVTAIFWDPEPANRLHLICANGSHLQYTWRSVTSTSQGQTQSDHGWAAVIDGCEVLLTPFRNMIVPPPMSAFALKLPTFVNQVIWSLSGDSNDLAVILQDGRVALYRLGKDYAASEDVELRAAGGNGFHVRSLLHTQQGIYKLTGKNGESLEASQPLHFHHFAWPSSDTILTVTYSSDNKNSTVMYFSVPMDSSEDKQMSLSRSELISGQIVSVAVHPSSGKVIFQTSDGQVVDDNSQLICKLPLTSVQIGYCTMQNKETVLGMTDRYRFYLNDVEIASDVTSFAVHSEFLILTTHSHTCKCIRLDQDSTNSLSVSFNTIEENVRRVERGSKIVLSVADDTKVILQMPRGNLETIHPRALVLSKVKKFLSKLDFGKAFDLVRRHRISMNILYDHSPQIFMEHIDDFVSGLETFGNINLFITDLKEEDTTVTMYHKSYPVEEATANQRPSGMSGDNNKVDNICDALRSALERINDKKYFLSMLTCLAKKKTPELELVLEKINELRLKVAEEADSRESSYPTDPKEYLPFLNELRKMPALYQKFNIDRHLKRYTKALQHLSQCPDRLDEFIKFVEEHALYSNALQIHPSESRVYKMPWISDIHFEYISGDILTVFLKDHRKSSDAAILYLDYCDDPEEAVVALLEATNWQEASRVVSSFKYIPLHLERATYGPRATCGPQIIKYGRADLFESNFNPTVSEAADNTLADLDFKKETFMKYKQRLAIVREEKRQQVLEFGEEGLNEMENDLYSETSSITGSTSGSISSSVSQYSQYSQRKSGRSSKNRRKADRKKYSLKEGSPHEELALMEALGGLVKTIDELREEIKQLLRALASVNMTTVASQVQKWYGDILKLMERNITEIWQLEEDPGDQKNVMSRVQQTINPTLEALKVSSGAQKKQLLAEMAFLITTKIERDTKWQLKMLDEI